MSKAQLLVWWGAVVAAAAAFAAQYGQLSKRKRRDMLLGLLVFLLIFIIPVVLLYLAPDEWFAKEAVLPRHNAVPAGPSQTTPIGLPSVPDHRRRDR